MVMLLALLAAVLGYGVLRRATHGPARALADAGALALVLACAAAGAWLVATLDDTGDAVSGALAGVMVGMVLADFARDALARRRR